MIQILFALVAGILTIGAPCILPLLPILLGASVGQKSKTRPLFIALGFVLTFTIVALTLSFLVQSLDFSPDLLRKIAVVALAVFGAFLIWPAPFEHLTRRLSGISTKAGVTASKFGDGNLGGFILGIMLGVIWTPCAGPILGSILTLVATSTDIGRAGILLVAYAVGAGIPMLVVAYGGQLITTRVRSLAKYATRIQQVFGVLILALAAAMYFQYDLVLQAKLLEFYDFFGLEEGILKDNPL
ncbi:MAG: cytochrome C biogenesis protein [Candidatus Doudnabacteria bacterium CG10_big_fil_rev_8_21_14_0_10_41_10]|uniref:Cytochrome C biogenesis protein n=1 Tax=Candidatus Doudnabacteria bacterium CG10_big_fil_rev_8_21_14_0_10_41_10 TaxID=1974551 RepID=A0A2H0VEZ3_9BACT|nr:MAG: cytochrome C biogenesis protein [Candidatus Doudnabacteria bacterium CG10_big_fil_rev_8_21_14_0_10_41_10]